MVVSYYCARGIVHPAISFDANTHSHSNHLEIVNMYVSKYPFHEWRALSFRLQQ